MNIQSWLATTGKAMKKPAQKAMRTRVKKNSVRAEYMRRVRSSSRWSSSGISRSSMSLSGTSGLVGRLGWQAVRGRLGGRDRGRLAGIGGSDRLDRGLERLGRL